MVSPDCPAPISDYGIGFVQSVCALMAESFLYGIYFVFMILAIRSLTRSRKKENKRSYLVMIISICFMFLLSTALVTLDATSRIAPNTSSHTNQFVLAQTIIFSFQFVFGDAIVVWRACNLVQYRWKLIIAPLVLLFASGAVATFFVGCMGVHGWYMLEHEARSCSRSQTGGYILSVATNFAATCLIAYTAWTHHKLVKSVRARKTGTLVENVLALLIESGFVYLLIWVSKCWTYWPSLRPQDSAAGYAEVIINSTNNQISGLYPTIIVVLIQMQQEQQTSIWSVGNIEPGNIHNIPSDPNSLPDLVMPSDSDSESATGGTSSSSNSTPGTSNVNLPNHREDLEAMKP